MAGAPAHLSKDLLGLCPPAVLSKGGLIGVVDGTLLANPFLCLHPLKGTSCKQSMYACVLTCACSPTVCSKLVLMPANGGGLFDALHVIGLTENESIILSHSSHPSQHTGST